MFPTFSNVSNVSNVSRSAKSSNDQLSGLSQATMGSGYPVKLTVAMPAGACAESGVSRNGETPSAFEKKLKSTPPSYGHF